MSTLVDNIRLSAFGGIRDSLELDFSAPLTLIYAPNGTGKTSIVESVDWLFGGDVREERCKLATDEEATEVTISATVGQKPLSAKRSLRNARVARSINGVATGEADFLQALAPECDVSELGAQARIPRLKAYLSANRVLGIDSLSRLIDSDNAESRADAMADLAGTRAQRNAQKMIDLYRRRLRDSLSKLESRLETLRAKQQEYLDLSVGRTDVDALVAEASRLLSSTGIEIRNDYASLTVYASSESELVDLKLRTLEQLRKLLGSMPALNDEQDIVNRILEIESEILGLHRASESEAERSHALNREIAALTRDIEGLQPVVDALANLRAAAEESATLRNLSATAEFISSLSLDPKSAEDLISELTGHISTASATFSRRDKLQSRIDALQNVLAALPARDELNDRIAEGERILAQSQSSRESLKSLRNEAIEAALRAHAHQDGESECPACGHDWGNHALLQEALKRTLSSLPSAEAQLLSNETAISTNILQLREQLSRASESELQIRQLQAELSSVTAQLQRANSLATRFTLGDIRSISDESITEWQRRIKVASAYQAFATASMSGPVVHLWSLDRTPEEETKALGSAIAALQAGITDKKQQVEAITSSINIRDLTISQLAQRLSKTRQSRDELDAWNRRVALARESLEIGSVSEPHLEEVERALRARQDSARMASEHLRSAGEIQAKAVLAQEARKSSLEASEVAQKIEAIEKEISRINIVDQQIGSQSDQHLQEMIEAVGPSVSQLFQRMQVNRVFESVEVSPTLELKGLLSDHEISPDMFSTGQRQDLAVAFFLVRAYAMGGSFFLDEPLAHLDDLNRVAVLDTLRAFVLSGVNAPKRTRLVLTTASWTTTRHVIQKFMRIQQGTPLLRVYQLTGNVSTSVSRIELFPKLT